MALCLVERPATILKWELYDLDHFSNIADLVRAFMDGNGGTTIDVIAIEKQPKCNVVMDSVSHVVSCAFYEYYLARDSRLPLITFIPPAAKYDLPDFTLTISSYEDRKQATVENVLKVLDPHWKQHLLEYHKKDDLADAYVLALVGMDLD